MTSPSWKYCFFVLVVASGLPEGVNPGSVFQPGFVTVTGILPEHDPKAVSQIGQIHFGGGPSHEERCLPNEGVDAVGGALAGILSSVSLGFLAIFRVEFHLLVGYSIPCGPGGARAVLVMPLQAEDDLVKLGRRKVGRAEVWRLGPAYTRRLGGQWADAALRKHGPRVGDEGVDQRALADPRVANEADRAFFAQGAFQSVDPCLVTIEFMNALRRELVKKRARPLTVPLANPLGSIPTTKFVVFHAVVNLVVVAALGAHFSSLSLSFSRAIQCRAGRLRVMLFVVVKRQMFGAQRSAGALKNRRLGGAVVKHHETPARTTSMVHSLSH